MTREEHLAWAKQRALEFVDLNQIPKAIASITSDLSKHPETVMARTQVVELMRMVLADTDNAAVRKFIEELK